MNEEVKYCNQCGAKISSDSKFCSGCGHDLKNSSTKITLDKTIKVEVTNATVEKGFKTVGKGFEAIGGAFKRNKEKREEVESKEERKKIIKQTVYRYPIINLIFLAVFIAIIFRFFGLI